MDILETIGSYAKERVAHLKLNCGLDEIKNLALNGPLPLGEFAFERALRNPKDKDAPLGFILECKKASPSKGVIAEEYNYLEIAKAYEKAGADCLSVLTEPKWFLGELSHLNEISSKVNLPCIRKDFIVDEYMIYEARSIGASAVLLIASLLGKNQLQEYHELARSLGLSVLVETHNKEEIERAINIGATLIGVNNRNLRDFSVDINHSLNLRENVTSNAIFVAESGIFTSDDVLNLKLGGADAVLIGESMMRAEDKTAKLRELKTGLYEHYKENGGLEKRPTHLETDDSAESTVSSEPSVSDAVVASDD